MHPSPYLTVPEAAEYLRSTPGSIRFKIHAGQLPYLKLGRRTLLERAALDALLGATRRSENGGGSIPGPLMGTDQ